MWWNLKCCPHCGGDTYIDEDNGQFFKKCLQCGYEQPVLEAPPPRGLSNKDDRVGSTR
jgi:hypothetical protein